MGILGSRTERWWGFGGWWRALFSVWDIERKLDRGAVDASFRWEDARELDMIALNHEDRVGEQRVYESRIPHEIPGLFRLVFEPLELLARHGELVVETEGFKVGHVAMQD